MQLLESLLAAILWALIQMVIHRYSFLHQKKQLKNNDVTQEKLDEILNRLPKPMLHGIDISYHQGVVDFETLRGLDFIIIRSSWGCPDPGQTAEQYIDTQFLRNRDEARRIGIRRGFYHFAYPALNSPEAEAAQFLGTVGKLQPGEFLALDIEREGTNTVDWCKKFLDIVSHEVGDLPLIYMNLDYVGKHDWTPVKTQYPLWLAQWDNNPDASVPHDISWPAGILLHQYGLSNFRCDGDTAYTELPLGFMDPSVVPVKVVPTLAQTYHRVKILRRVNIRTQPNTLLTSKVKRPMAIGEPLDYIKAVKGEMWGGSDIWLLKPDGLYVWAKATSFNLSTVT